MQDVFRQTVITSLTVGAISTVVLMFIPIEIIPCGDRQCAGYLGYKLEYFESAPGATNFALLLFYSILFAGIITLATFFITLIILYMKAGAESKL